MYTIETLPHSNFVDSTILLIAIRFHYFSLLWREWVQNICVVPPCHSYLFVFLHFHDGLILCAAPSRFHMAYKAYLCAILPNSLAIDLSNESDSSEFGNRIATLNIELGWVRSNLNLAWYARIGRIISWAYSFQFLSSHIEMPRCTRVQFNWNWRFTDQWQHWMRTSTARKKFFVLVILTRRKYRHLIIVSSDCRWTWKLNCARYRVKYKVQIWSLECY